MNAKMLTLKINLKFVKITWKLKSVVYALMKDAKIITNDRIIEWNYFIWKLLLLLKFLFLFFYTEKHHRKNL